MALSRSEAHILASNGPDRDPLSVYNTTQALHHDLKVSLTESVAPSASASRQGAGSGFGMSGIASQSSLSFFFLPFCHHSHDHWYVPSRAQRPTSHTSNHHHPSATLTHPGRRVIIPSSTLPSLLPKASPTSP